MEHCVNLLPVVWNIEANPVALSAALVVNFFLSFLLNPIGGSVKHYLPTCDCVIHSETKLLLCKT
jgi:hypothetical protein